MLDRLKSFENPALKLISHSVVVSNLDEARVFSRPDRLTVARVTLPAATGHWIYVSSRTETERKRKRERQREKGKEEKDEKKDEKNRDNRTFQVELKTRQIFDCT